MMIDADAPPAPRGKRRGPRLALAGLALAIIVGALAAVFWAPEPAIAWIGRTATGLRDEAPAAAALAIFGATYVVIALGKLPGFHLDRTGAALLGAGLMVGFGIVRMTDAYKAIDFDTITLLLGMMIVVANLRLSGFFRLATNRVVEHARHPLMLLTAVTFASGVFSAFLMNDAICLVLAPLVLELVARLKRNPVPYLLAVAMASNIGSVATITGNPQNMMIGSFSKIPYDVFAAALSPVAAIGLLLTVALIAGAYRGEFWTRERLRGAPAPARMHQPLAIKSVVVTAAMMIAFFLGQPPAKVAIVAGAFLLLTRIVKNDKVYREIDWPLLLMFAGLFVVVSGLEKTLLSPEIIAALGRLHLDRAPFLGAVTVALSNLVSNVPAVLVLKPFVAALPDPQHGWLLVAMASTLAGNLTLLGSVVNLIVVQQAASRGVVIGFWDYTKVGAPLTVLTILVGLLRLM